jgi:glucuronate isomerase
MPFITDDFLLQSDAACELYHDYAKQEPIFDYHCHISPEEIAENRQFKNLFEIWLAGDHYKWRAMRANGVSENYCTGEATDYDKFLVWAKTVPETLRNPLYHWSHLELKRYFDIDTLLSESTAEEIWNEAHQQLATPELSVHGILKKQKVAVICTTDDPTDSLEYHQQIAHSDLPTKVYPTFRPDKALAVDNPDAFNPWTEKLVQASDGDCATFKGFLEALKQRHDFFHSIGGRLSDHGLESCYADSCSETEAATIYDQAHLGKQVTVEQHSKFASFMMVYFGLLDANRGWVKQLHLGAIRSNNTRQFTKLGPDTGFDSIGDFSQVKALQQYLDTLDQNGRLPKTIVYNLNPGDNYLFATMMGNFQDGSIPGKMQFGSGWWFLDQKEAMQWQINALSNLGLLSRFVGMLTDSRSFMSYCRHEYFRRVLCNMIGQDIEKGEIPRDMDLVGKMVKNICFGNAKNYFELTPGSI